MESRLASGRVDNTFLARKNAHERDERIVFDEEPHLYYIDGSTEGYVSVTTYVHSHFESFDADRIIANMMKSKRWESNEKYYGKTPEQIKKEWQDNCDKAAAEGTRMHYVIESFYNEKYNPDSMLHNIDPLYDYDDDEKDDDDVEEESELVIDELDREELGMVPHETKGLGLGQGGSDKITNALPSSSSISLNGTSIEFSYFLNFLHDHPHLIPYRTEWTVFHEELKLAGSIDMLFFDESTYKYHIYDWKRCRNIQKSNPFDKWGNKECINHFPDTNFWHYSLQLNIYKAILERKYNMTIDGLFLVCLHPNNKNSNYIKLKAPNLQEEVGDLFALRSLDLEIHI